MVKDYIDIRAVFSKEGRAVFISHLDLMRTMQRAFSARRFPFGTQKATIRTSTLCFRLRCH